MDINFSVLGDPLKELIKAFPNLIRRQWPTHLSADNGLQVLLHGFAIVTANTYRTILWVIAEKPEYLERQPEFVLSVPPLIRSILEHAFSVCFLSEDPPGRSLWYHKSGWREILERHTREHERYGSYPKWQLRLTESRKMLHMLEGLAQITPEEKANPKKAIEYWPIPHGMIKHCQQKRTRDFLEFLEDWFYRELSQEAHLSQPGLISRAYPLISELPAERIREQLALHRSMAAVTTVTLIVALLSEIQGILKFPEINVQLKFLWGLLEQLWNDPKDLYERRYRDLLTTS